MSIDEGDLRASLNSALDEFDCGSMPLDSVISQGRRVVLRRRLTATASALAVAVAAVAAPVIAHQIGRPTQPVAPSRHYHLTVHSPGPHSPKGLVAYGRLNQRHWRITGSAQRENGHMYVCFDIVGNDCNIGPIPAARNHGELADFPFSSGPNPTVLVGDVRSDVRALRLGLSNGQIVTLKPVAVFGRSHAPWVGVMLPYASAVTMITAYSAHGQLGYAIPFTHDGTVTVVRWLAPGQPPPARATYKIAVGKVNGKPWAEYLYVGPWGSCLDGAGDGSWCIGNGPGGWVSGKPALLVVQNGGSSASPAVAYYFLAAKPAVSYVVVHFKNAAPVRVPAVSAGSVKFAGFASAPPDAATRWVAYSAGGKVLATGKIRSHSGEQG